VIFKDFGQLHGTVTLDAVTRTVHHDMSELWLTATGFSNVGFINHRGYATLD
jgi:hypothetical protein